MSELLEETGYSYSGISDLIHNEPEKTKPLLLEINREYTEAKSKMEALQKELEEVARYRGLIVSSFIHAHRSLGLGSDPLCFVDNNKTIVVDIKEGNKINYEAYPHTELTAYPPAK